MNLVRNLMDWLYRAASRPNYDIKADSKAKREAVKLYGTKYSGRNHKEHSS